MNLSPSSSSSSSRIAGSPAWLAGPAFLAAALLAWHGPIPQWPGYHHFADTRTWLGIPNTADVLSNLPFALAGAWGLVRLRAAARHDAAAMAWRVFAMAVVCTAAGSSAYHWQPDNLSLVFDRLPIAWACAALMCAFLAERVHPRWADPPVLAAALAAALAAGGLSVAWWWFTERQGVGDLRPYLAVQLLPMGLVPLGLALRLPARGAHDAVPGPAWMAALGLYAAAKGFEVLDRTVLEALGFASGHTLKHLVAAAAAAWLLAAASANGSRGRVRSGSRR
jgi:hypothetical protein